MRLTPEQIEQQIREGGLTVSGGKDGNPPDKYEIVQLFGIPTEDLAKINAVADQGFRFEAVLPFNQVLMGNYKENK
jgi:hypothetical protein